MPRPIVFLTLAAMACNRLGGADFGQGPENDARFVADVYTWQCQAEGQENWEGVFAFDVSLEVAPDALVPRSLPAAGGCSADLSMFGADPNSELLNIPEVTDEPRWETDTDSGELKNLSEGWYYDQVFEDVHNCTTADDLLTGGTRLLGAGSLTGAITPDPGDIWDVTMLSTSDYEETGFVFGEEIEVDWDVEGWDEAWIQVRREREGEAWEFATCNITGLDSFVIGDNVWGLMTPELTGVTNNVFVAFQNHRMTTMEDGQKVEVATRAMHVAVLPK